MQKINFIAIDFETATGKRSSICEAGICVVREGRIGETKSWLVRPPENLYHYWNIRIHGISPQDTECAPGFPEVWRKIAVYLRECPVLIAHNAAFDMGCIRHALEFYGIEKPEADCYCSLLAARHIYRLDCHSLDYLCDRFEISYGQHHRAGDDAEMCARLFLREIEDAGVHCLEEMAYCNGKL